MLVLTFTTIVMQAGQVMQSDLGELNTRSKEEVFYAISITLT